MFSTLSEAVAGNEETRRRFQREVRAAAKLDHANIVTAFDADEAGGVHFLVMERERALDTRHADTRSDVYGLGCVLYDLLAGEAVFGGGTVVKKIFAHRDERVLSLSERRSDVSAALDAAFQRMLAQDPAQLYQTMSEVIAELEPCRVGVSGSPFGQGPWKIPRTSFLPSRKVAVGGCNFFWKTWNNPRFRQTIWIWMSH